MLNKNAISASDTGTLSFTDIDERARSDSRRASASIGLGGNAADERGGVVIC